MQNLPTPINYEPIGKHIFMRSIENLIVQKVLQQQPQPQQREIAPNYDSNTRQGRKFMKVSNKSETPNKRIYRMKSPQGIRCNW